MNVSYQKSVFTSFIFGFSFLFIVCYFSIVGPNEYLHNKIHFLINSIVILLSLSSFAIMLLLTNKKEKVHDERDNYIQKKATSVGLLITALYVFSLSIVLFIIYRDDQYITVTWLWFIAYSTFAFTYFSTSLLNVYFYKVER